MPYSMVFINGSNIPLKWDAIGECRKQRRNIVCCCPWSGSDATISDLAQTKKYNENNSKNSKSPNKNQRLPPGPSMLDLIGLMPYVARAFPYHHPLRDLANTYGPLVHVKLGEVSTIVVSSAVLAKEVLKTRDPAFANRPKSIATQLISYGYTDVVLTPYGEYWKQMRNICVSKFLSPKNVRALEHIRKDEGLAVVNFIESTRGGPFDLTERIFLYMNSTACKAVFGNVSIDTDEAVTVIKRGVSLGANFALADVFPSIKVLDFISWNKYQMSKLRKKVDRVLDKIIDDHRKNLTLKRTSNGELDTEDFVDVLLRLKESGGLNFPITDDNIKSLIADMIGANTESSSALVDWAMAELVRNPHVMAKAQGEIRQAFNGRNTIQESEIEMLKYLKLVIKETLRLHPPTSIITRACREEIELDGYHIPLDANVIVNIWAIGRDPKYWYNPESFVPERFEESHIDFMGAHFEYIPFGAGKRICPGMTLGLANVEFLLAQLLFHFDWRLPPGISPDGLDMTETDGTAVSRKNGLNLIATPYEPAALAKTHSR